MNIKNISDKNKLALIVVLIALVSWFYLFWGLTPSNSAFFLRITLYIGLSHIKLQKYIYNQKRKNGRVNHGLDS